MELYSVVAVLLLTVSSPLLVNADDSDDNRDRIVIHTPLQNYEQPSLRDYEECQTNRKNCMTICAGKSECESECPLCPELTDEPLLVQGVNDTFYVPPATPAINTTNIIRLTNEINNVIQNDIQTRNEVNVKVHQNVSQVGGRFGLGYNEQGSCCYVVRHDRNCDESKEQCTEHSRHRVCGQRCQARIMIAKLIVVCMKEQPEDCHETVEYVPARRHRSRHRNQQQSAFCRYMDSWPYVACGDQVRDSRRYKRANCERCEKLTYGYILHNGLPAECTGCFAAYATPIMPAPIFYAPYAPLPNYGYSYMPHPANQQHDNDIDADNDDNGWELETEECSDADGQLMKCPHKGDNDATAPSQKTPPPANLEQGNNNNNNNDNDNNNNSLDYNYGSGYDVPAQHRRHRRHHSNPSKFVRSIYSRRTDEI